MRGCDSAEAHARGVNHKMCGQISTAGDGGFTDSDWSTRIAFLLNRRAAPPANCARDTCTKHEVVVGRVDNGVHFLLDQVAADDHDSRRRDSSTSATRLANSSGVAFAMPLTPIDPMVIDAQATPHTSASCKPLGSPPVLNHRASIPPASASPAPVVSTTGRLVTAGIRKTPSSMYEARPSSPALTT